MSKQFIALNIGDTFSSGVSQGVGINAGNEKEMLYKKISKSKAECIAQRGYGNTRAIGNVYAFAPYQKVYNAPKV